MAKLKSYDDMKKNANGLVPFTVKRSMWVRSKGKQVFNSGLRTDNGKQCCMGFLAKQHGYTNEEISFREYLYELKASDVVFNEEISSPAIQEDIAKLNDDPCDNPKRREAKLKKLFASVGYDVTFVD